MSSIKGTDAREIRFALCDMLLTEAKELGVYDQIECYSGITQPSFLFGKLLEAARAISDRRLVILFDEYDYPLLECIGTENAEETRSMFADFYSVLKDKQPLIEFCLIAGITRFPHVSIFSKLNNLVDISDLKEYSSLCGFTEAELDRFLSPYFTAVYENLGLENDREKAEFRDKVRRYYDGYRFSPYGGEPFYNPVSIGSFLKLNSSNNIGFANFWIDTGGMATIRKLVHIHGDFLKQEQPWLVGMEDRSLMEVSDIFKPDASREHVYAYLFQCGYLTIKYCDEDRNLVLVYPNEEVASTIVSMLLSDSLKTNVTPSFVTKLAEGLKEENIESIVSSLNRLYASIPWQTNPRSLEGPFEGIFLALMLSMGWEEDTIGEMSTSGGTSDIGSGQDQILSMSLS